jgi:hypothetical protein
MTSALVGDEPSAKHPWLLYLWGRSPLYPLDRRLGVPQSQSRRHKEVKILHPTGTRYPTPPPPPTHLSSPKPVSILASLSWNDFYSFIFTELRLGISITCFVSWQQIKKVIHFWLLYIVFIVIWRGVVDTGTCLVAKWGFSDFCPKQRSYFVLDTNLFWTSSMKLKGK